MFAVHKKYTHQRAALWDTSTTLKASLNNSHAVSRLPHKQQHFQYTAKGFGFKLLSKKQTRFKTLTWLILCKLIWQ